MSDNPEAWLEQVAGSGPVIVVAPHGGRRRREVRPDDSVNDLHTAGIAREFARRLGAPALINHGLDRNDTDLNRISELVSDGHGFLELLAGLVEAAVDGQGRALVLLVHGWNMAVPGCDIGVGLKSRGGAPAGRYPTVGQDCLATSVAHLCEALRAGGLSATLGHRYPAAGADNATQLFSGRHAEHADPVVGRLGGLAASGRIDAIQLETGIPLRWPGARRETFIEAVVEAARAYPLEAEPKPRRPVERAGGGAAQGSDDAVGPEPGYSLQFILDRGRTSVLFGVEPTGPHSMATRLCLLRDDGSMSLFVAEGPWDGQAGRYRIAGLSVDARTDGGLELAFEGPMIAYPSHDAFLDLERGLSSAGLEEVSLTLSYSADQRGFGKVSGRLDLPGSTIDIATTAATGRGPRFAAGRGGGTVLRVVEGKLGPRRIELAGALPETEAELPDSEGHLWKLRPLAVVPLVRAVGDKRFRVSFGVVAAEGEQGQGLAAFESVALETV